MVLDFNSVCYMGVACRHYHVFCATSTDRISMLIYYV